MTAPLLTPEVGRTLARLLRTGANVKAAAGAIDINNTTVLGWIKLGATDHRYASVRRAFEAGLERTRREERDLARRASALLMGGATVKATAEALGIGFHRLKGLIIRARGSDGRAPDPGLSALAQRFPTQSRKGRKARPRCRHCGAVLPASSARRAA
jgi:transposase-like protein